MNSFYRRYSLFSAISAIPLILISCISVIDGGMFFVAGSGFFGSIKQFVPVLYLFLYAVDAGFVFSMIRKCENATQKIILYSNAVLYTLGVLSVIWRWVFSGASAFWTFPAVYLASSAALTAVFADSVRSRNKVFGVISAAFAVVLPVAVNLFSTADINGAYGRLAVTCLLAAFPSCLLYLYSIWRVDGGDDPSLDIASAVSFFRLLMWMFLVSAAMSTLFNALLLSQYAELGQRIGGWLPVIVSAAYNIPMIIFAVYALASRKNIKLALLISWFAIAAPALSSLPESVLSSGSIISAAFLALTAYCLSHDKRILITAVSALAAGFVLSGALSLITAYLASHISSYEHSVQIVYTAISVIRIFVCPFVTVLFAGSFLAEQCKKADE